MVEAYLQCGADTVADRALLDMVEQVGGAANFFPTCAWPLVPVGRLPDLLPVGWLPDLLPVGWLPDLLLVGWLPNLVVQVQGRRGVRLFWLLWRVTGWRQQGGGRPAGGRARRRGCLAAAACTHAPLARTLCVPSAQAAAPPWPLPAPPPQLLYEPCFDTLRTKEQLGCARPPACRLFAALPPTCL